MAAIENQVAMAMDDEATVEVDTVENVCEAELKAYLGAPMLAIRKPKPPPGEKVKETHNDPLEWWKKHESYFPILATLAQIYLAIQATSAPSERVFSAASRIVSAKKASLKPHMVGKLFFVSRNWKWFYGQMSLQEAMEELDLTDE